MRIIKCKIKEVFLQIATRIDPQSNLHSRSTSLANLTALTQILEFSLFKINSQIQTHLTMNYLNNLLWGQDTLICKKVHKILLGINLGPMADVSIIR